MDIASLYSDRLENVRYMRGAIVVMHSTPHSYTHTSTLQWCSTILHQISLHQVLRPVR
jgi:hypothetical protein